MRDILRTLTDAAEVVDSAADAAQQGRIQVDELYAAIDEMRVALDKAHRALDESQHLMVFTEGGKVGRILADHQSDLDCTLVNWDTESGETWDESLVEVEWPETKERRKLLIESKHIEHEPGMVAAIVHAQEELRDEALAALKTFKSSI
jgi:hypothetical protein